MTVWIMIFETYEIYVRPWIKNIDSLNIFWMYRVNQCHADAIAEVGRKTSWRHLARSAYYYGVLYESVRVVKSIFTSIISFRLSKAPTRYQKNQRVQKKNVCFVRGYCATRDRHGEMYGSSGLFGTIDSKVFVNRKIA